MNLISNILSDRLNIALGWNVFHILWQGLLIALFLSLFLRILKNNSAQLRYLISFSALLLMVGLSVFNLYTGYNISETDSSGSYSTMELERPNKISTAKLNDINIKYNNFPILETLKSTSHYVKPYLPLVANLWLTGVLLFILKFIITYLYTNRLKTNQTNNISSNWQITFAELEAVMGIQKPINYLISKIVQVPIVLGFLKPYVIIPFEMLSGMPSNQIEAIIAHELAHIQRNDYIFNVIQTIIETVFFFHPAVWYISSQIRNERENCCDDIALTVCDGSLVYAKALVSIQELSLQKYYSAVAFAGKNKHLLTRIKRTIMKQKEKSNYMEKVIASAIILSGVFALSFTYGAKTNDLSLDKGFSTESIVNVNTPVIESKILSKIHKPSYFSKDTAQIKDRKYDTDLQINDNTVTKKYSDKKGNKKEIKFTLENGKASNLFVDGKRIPENEYNKYQDKIDDTIKDLKNAKKDVAEAIKNVEELDLDKMRLDVEEAVKDIHIDLDEVHDEIENAMQSIHEINFDEIIKDVELNLVNLEDIDLNFDFDETLLKLELENVKEELIRVKESVKEEIDAESIQKELVKVQEELFKIKEEEIKTHMAESVKQIEEIDKKGIKKELQEKLEELEKLELEEK